MDAVNYYNRLHIFLQSNPIAVGYAVGGARILEHVIHTGSDGLDAAIQQLRDPKRAFPLPTDEDVAGAIEKGKAAKGKTHPEAVKEFGLPCCMLLDLSAVFSMTPELCSIVGYTPTGELIQNTTMMLNLCVTAIPNITTSSQAL